MADPTPPPGDPAPTADTDPAPPNDTAATDAPTGEDTPPPVGDGLGEGGKKALQAERAARKTAEQQAKTLQAELDKLREAQMSDQERAVAEARRQGETEATTKAQRRLFAAEAKVAAAGKIADPTLLSDPDVALSLLGLDEIPVDNDGDIDSEAISGAIDRLIEGRPFLKAGTQAHATWPSNGSEAGPRGDDAKSQLTRDHLKTMSPQEIVKAKAEGRLRDVLSGKTP